MYNNQTQRNTTQVQREFLQRLQQQNRASGLLNNSHNTVMNNNSNNPTPKKTTPSTYGSRPGLMANSSVFTLLPYKTRKDAVRRTVLQKYSVLGYIASGTYGRVYKAECRQDKKSLYAIKKFKADKEGEIVSYTGISQSASREMALCRELNHTNITKLAEIILENKCIYMVFEYADHDLLQIIHYHTHPDTKSIPDQVVKSIMWQVLNGVSYLHQNWILHRDLKPANIMVTSQGVVKIGDLGLARKFNNPLQTLYNGDKVVVTIWYRAPELLLGGRHYTSAIDLWAVGCIFAELLALRPMFKGEEAKMDNKKNVPFQRNQMQKIVEILGTPTVNQWQSLPKYPEYTALQEFKQFPSNLQAWYQSIGATNKRGLELLASLLVYDPAQRMTAFDALIHPYFLDPPRVLENIFEGQNFKYPSRRIHADDSDITSSQTNTAKRAAFSDDTFHQRKKIK